MQNSILFIALSQFCSLCIGLYNKLVNRKCFFVVISGPPAIGKNTVCNILIKKLRQDNIKINFIKSYTTRSIRNSEDSYNYHFISKEKFTKKINDNQMLEYIINPNNQQYYGFALSDIKYNLTLRRNSIVIPTYNFLLNLQKYINDKKITYCKIISIYLLPNSIEDIKSRILMRGSESKEEIKRRIKSVESDIKTSVHYDIQIVNKKSRITANSIHRLLKAELDL